MSPRQQRRRAGRDAQAREALRRQLNEFIDGQLVGVVRRSDIEELASERAAIPEGRTKNPLGQFTEQIEVRFDRFKLIVESTERHPPLGQITCHCGDETTAGPLDSATWGRVGHFIKERMSENVTQ